jgi:hypothetical protein
MEGNARDTLEIDRPTNASRVQRRDALLPSQYPTLTATGFGLKLLAALGSKAPVALAASNPTMTPTCGSLQPMCSGTRSSQRWPIRSCPTTCSAGTTTTSSVRSTVAFTHQSAGQGNGNPGLATPRGRQVTEQSSGTGYGTPPRVFAFTTGGVPAGGGRRLHLCPGAEERRGTNSRFAKDSCSYDPPLRARRLLASPRF